MIFKASTLGGETSLPLVSAQKSNTYEHVQVVEVANFKLIGMANITVLIDAM